MGDVLAVRSPDAKPATVRVDGGTQSASGTRLIALDDQGVARQLALIHRSHGLAWDQVKQMFTGVLLVGIVDLVNPGEEAKLPRPIAVQLLSDGNALDPSELQIDQIGGRMQRVNVAIADPKDPYEIRLVSQVDRDLPEALLPLERIQLVLMAPEEIDALGVGSGEVTVRGRNGRLPKDDAVTLNLDYGDLEQTTLTVGNNGIASTRIRSTGLGTGELSVIAGPYDASPVRVRYGFPIMWIIATLLGAMLGSFVFVYALKRGGLRDWLIGVAVGIGATVMAYAGMKLPGWVSMPRALVGFVVPMGLAFVCSAGTALLVTFLTGKERA